MRYLASQGLFLLLTFLGLLSLFHASWRPVFALALSLIVVAHICYSLIVNDSLLSPQVPAAFLRLLASLATWLYITSKLVVAQAVRLFGFGRVFWRQKVLDTMKRLWNRYQLSSDVNETRSYRDANVQYDENKRASRSFDYGDALGLTSTPLVTQKGIKNGGLSYSTEKRDSVFGDGNNGSLKEESRLYNADCSPWSATNSPRMRPRASGIKTVQTVAGPLLASTRYNIDPKVYFDVTSPGLTGRITKYASEPNKLTHQSRYAAGQFPKVNLHASPVPLIKPIKKTTPVTVRVAQPVANKLTSTQKKVIRSQMNEKKSTNMYEALKEISLKRHASRDDVSELIKKQRTEMSYQDELGNLEEMTQKRARDDSPKSDEDLSSDYKNLRPKKRTKTPSCNDIINSLSSSIHVFSGTKRKAEDTSQEFEKHFKSQDMSQQSASAKEVQQSPDVSMRTANESVDSSRSSLVQEEDNFLRKPKSPQPAKLSDKLFMGAEPEKNEKLQALIEEQSHVNPKFSLDDKDEIRREDITLMRQTSMKARLQSMFDAVSGKSNKINPDVVIHAEEIGKESSSSQVVSTPVSNVPTSSAITPILKAHIVEKSATPKRVTFNLTTSSQPATTTSTAPTFQSTPLTSNLTSTPVSEAPKLVLPSSSSSSTPKFSFGSAPAASTAVSSPVTPSLTKTVSLDNKTSSTTTVSFVAPTSVTPAQTTSAATGYTPSFGGGVGAATSSTSTIATSSSPRGPTHGTSTTPSFSFGKSQSSPISAETKMIFRSASTASEIVKPTYSFEQSTPTMASSTVFSMGEQSNVKMTFGQSTPATTTSTSLSFGQPAAVSESKPTQPPVTTSSTPVMSFGQTNAVATTAAFSFGQSSATTSAPPLKFNSTTSSGPTFAFGQAAKTTSSSTMTFGQTTTVSSSSSSTMSLGQPSSTSSGSTMFGAKPAAVENKPAFGAAATTSSGTFNTPTFVFGGGAAPTNTFGQGKGFTANTTSSSSFTLTPSFTSPTTTTAPTNIFNTTTVTTSANMFGSTSTPATTTTSSMFSGGAFKFGSSTNPPAFGAAATTSATPTFGTATPTAAPTFGATNAAPIFGATTTAPPPSFGSTVNTTSAASFGTSTFGSTAPPPPYGATFSASKPAAPAFGATAPTAAPTFGATSSTPAPTFGAASSTTAPTFGATTTTAAPTFGASASSTSTPAFGSTAAPAFGAQTNPPPAFGSTTTPSLNFGATSNGFGSAPTQSPFSGGSMQSPSFGGSTAATPATNFPNGSFSFSGSSAPQPAAQPASQSGFNFSASSNSTGGTGGGVFQFGAGGSKPGGGFNFSAPSGTPNVNFGATPTAFGGAPQTPGGNFGTPAQGGNMFSIGTGSTARPRANRDRLRRR